MVDLKHLNWTSPVLGLCLIGLEAGYIYLYRVGWQISVGSIVGNILLALILLAIGILFYNETISLKQIIGILFCVLGLVFINLK